MAVDWDAPDWGNRVHLSAFWPDDHDKDEAAAEATRG